jgi:D-serine deaminase-like pyridoxal phosphate-dependent protein
MDSLAFLKESLQAAVGIFLEIDTGYHRSGISSRDQEGIGEMLRYMASEPLLDFRGFLIHSGNTYRSDSVDGIKNIYSHDLNQLLDLVQSCSDLFPEAIISIGDTPSCSIIEDLSGVDEIRPGNFIFYDVMQYNLGVCSTDEIAVAVACPVVAKNAARDEIVIYGGAVHLSKESLADPDGTLHYGLVVQFNAHGWSRPLENTRVTSLSQEHGIIKTTTGIFNAIKRGDILGILPVHSCLANDLLLGHDLVINERY